MSFYDVLGVSKNATTDEIKSAYKKMVIKCHPDKGGNKEEFQKIQEAYETLSDDNKRREYDNPNPFSNGFPQGFPQGFPFSGGFPQQQQNVPNGFPFNFFNFVNTQMNHQTNQNKDHIFVCKITLGEAFHGANKTFNIRRKYNCRKCHKVCDMCNGSGMINSNQTIRIGPVVQVLQQNCNKCQAKGYYKENRKCDDCNSSGVKYKEKFIEINIPRGVKEGQQYFYEEWGEQGEKPDEKPGNLIIKIEIENKDNVFRKEGLNLHYDVTINVLESIVGKVLSIPHYEGELNIDIKKYCIINPNIDYVEYGKGFIDDKGKRGNLIIKFKIIYPQRILNDNECEILKNVFDELKLI